MRVTLTSTIRSLRDRLRRLPEPEAEAELPESVPDLLVRLGAAGELDDLAIVSRHLFVESPFARLAANAASRLFARAKPLDYVALDQEARRWLSYYHLTSRTQTIALLERLGSVSALGVGSFHPSGYIRESAVTNLEGHWSGDELPFLLVRANDWVAEVRFVAVRALMARANPSYAAHFLRFLPLVRRLAQTRRAENSEIVEAVETLLRSPEADGVLRAGCLSAEPTVRRASFQLRLEDKDRQVEAAGDALRERDPIIRLWAVRALATQPAQPELRGLLERMIADSSSAVRAVAIDLFCVNHPDEAKPLLWSSLLDRSASIRAASRWKLTRHEPVDFGAVYREALATAEGFRLVAAIYGLGEIGCREAAEDVASFLKHSRLNVRVAAIRALSGITQNEFLGRFEAALSDDLPKVSTAARRALESRSGLLSEELLWRLFENDGRRHVRLNALLLMGRLGKWDRIFYFLRAASDSDPDLAAIAEQEVRGWQSTFNRSFTAPTAEQKQRILAAGFQDVADYWAGFSS